MDDSRPEELPVDGEETTRVARVKRFWEVDSFRGLAIVMMVTYHLAFDLNYFGVYAIDVSAGGWRVFQRIIGTLFISIVGVSLALSYSRARQLKGLGVGLFPKYLKRGLWIFAWGLAITLVTWIVVPQGVIVFGVLHLIGLSVILAFPFLRLGVWNLAIGAVVIGVGAYLQQFTFDSSWLVWLGLMPHKYFTLDYFPVFPWFGVSLVGLGVGSLLYTGPSRRFALSDLSGVLLVRLLGFLGRHSLVIYVLHQPLLIGLLALLGFVDITAFV